MLARHESVFQVLIIEDYTTCTSHFYVQSQNGLVSIYIMELTGREGGGRVLNLLFTGRLCLEVQTQYPFIFHFWQER